MKNIVVIGVAGSGVNFLKNIFLLSDKLRLDLPYPVDTPITNRYFFITDYYNALIKKINNSKNWLEHEWLLRMSNHWTDELDTNQHLIKIDSNNPTVFVLHHEKEIIVNDPIDVVSIVVDNKKLCDTLYQVKSNIKEYKNLFYDVLLSNPHPRRTYSTILFSDLLKNPLKIFELTNSFDLNIDLDKIKTIHRLWIESNKILLTSKGITNHEL